MKTINTKNYKVTISNSVINQTGNHYVYTYYNDGKPYYVGSGEGPRSIKRTMAEVQRPLNLEDIHYERQNMTSEDAQFIEGILIGLYGREGKEENGVLKNRIFTSTRRTPTLETRITKAKMISEKISNAWAEKIESGMSSTVKRKNLSPENFEEDGVTPKVITRKEAKNLGLKYYFKKPCKHGHISLRRVESMGCLQCISDTTLRIYYEKHKAKYL